jgi:hypothetical protein
MRIKIIFMFLLSGFLFLTTGCSDKVLTVTPKPLPVVDQNQTVSITLFRLNNYTDTPRAGMRAANIVEGVLNAKGYTVLYSKNETQTKEAVAQENHTDYYMTGAVSEWRYKTGIDGEPAVSLRLALYNTKTNQLVWSGVGSDNSWGNASIGSTAQSLLENMLK